MLFEVDVGILSAFGSAVDCVCSWLSTRSARGLDDITGPTSRLAFFFSDPSHLRPTLAKEIAALAVVSTADMASILPSSRWKLI
jgi:hypothetical protein